MDCVQLLPWLSARYAWPRQDVRVGQAIAPTRCMYPGDRRPAKSEKCALLPEWVLAGQRAGTGARPYSWSKQISNRDRGPRFPPPECRLELGQEILKWLIPDPVRRSDDGGTDRLVRTGQRFFP